MWASEGLALRAKEEALFSLTLKYISSRACSYFLSVEPRIVAKIAKMVKMSKGGGNKSL